MQRPTPALAEGKPIPEELQKQVIDDVRKAISSWDDAQSADLCQHSFGLQLSHKVMAAMMDSLFKRYCKDHPGAEKTLLDTDLKKLLTETIDALLPQADPTQWKELMRMKDVEFEPRVRETFAILQDHFDDVTHLRSFAAKERWRLLVDPLKIDMLERHGIDPNNPLLAFIFDTDKSYAHTLAQGWVEAMTLAEQPFSLRSVLDIVDLCSPMGFSKKNPSFRAFCSPAGKLRIAEFMTFLEREFQVHTAITFSDKRFEHIHGTIRRHLCLDFKPWVTLAGSVKVPMEVLIANRASDSSPREKFEFQRKETSKSTLKKVYQHIVDDFNRDSALHVTSDEKLLAAADAYLRGETLHALGDSNFRVWGMLVLNMLLVMQGEQISLLYDPNVSDGASREEVAEMLRKGQEWCSRYVTAEI